MTTPDKQHLAGIVAYALATHCPTCKAPAGEPCNAPTLAKHYAVPLHLTRQDKAMRRWDRDMWKVRDALEQEWERLPPEVRDDPNSPHYHPGPYVEARLPAHFRDIRVAPPHPIPTY